MALETALLRKKSAKRAHCAKIQFLFLLTVVPVARQGKVGVKMEAVDVPEESCQ